MPCSTCASLQDKIQKARAELDPEKERVMRTILENHLKISHPATHNVVAIDVDVIVWPDGTRWKVVR
jgi:hypothetical protein